MAEQKLPIATYRHEIRVTRLTVCPEGASLFDERSTDVELRDEAAGEFVAIRQKSMDQEAENQVILVEDSDWPNLKSAVEYLLQESKERQRE